MDMNPMLDYCFTPALRQTISHTGIKKWLWRIRKILQQKGDLDLIQCDYHLCNKQFLPEKAFTGELIYMHGNMIARKKRKYCSAACAEKDKMAHEL
ncbi:hypothetical protein JRA98_004719 [Escherichia coli O28ac]|nr:hypothetical protein [Escherichia coli]EFP8270788.1 hypothetical protein [Shigella sonnei]EFW7285862.1 hypothetical protein [Shigella boydii]EFY9881303.1 hypothetical protein [Shigella dysenteriae]EGF7271583.1 hypothetical protein [Shigella flexneri]EHD3365890.1 hypothetical protein [Escherichia coli O124]EHD3370592.1 hypothetical protein [Escherichia coli O28ac]EHD3402150.1 hypothetical protein [Escherichia coli O152]